MKTQTEQTNDAFETIQSNLQERVSKTSTISLILGILILILGIEAIIYPSNFGTLSTMAIGGIIILSGIFRFGFAIFSTSIGTMLMRYLFSIIMIVAGVWIFSNPQMGLEALTIFMAVYFIFDGITSIAFSFTLRVPGLGIHLLIGGLISVLLGVLIFYYWPESSNLALGMYLGIKLIVDGSMLTLSSYFVKKSTELKLGKI